MTNKLTKKSYYSAIIRFCDSNPDAIFDRGITLDMMRDFALHEIALLDKKSSSTGAKKLSPQQIENEKIKSEILNYLADRQPHTITDMMNNVPALVSAENMSVHRVSAILSQLCDKGTNEVERVVVKRVTYFKLREC